MGLFTFGSELEIADLDTRILLPEGNKWDHKDYTIANSSGIGNDPKKELVKFGSEINVKPTDSVESQVEEIFKIYGALGDRKSVNYTTNLHIHVHVPGLSEDLPLLRKVASYIYKFQGDIFSITEKLIPPIKSDYDSEEAFKGAKKRFARRKISHQNKLSDKIYNKMMSASSIQQFYESHAPVSKDGKLQWQLATRCGVNLMQLFNETDTIEYRHFSMSFDLDEIFSCVQWCELVTEAMVGNQKSPMEIFRDNPGMVFPGFQKYDHRIANIFKLTHFGKLTREQIEINLVDLLDKGVIKMEDIV